VWIINVQSEHHTTQNKILGHFGHRWCHPFWIYGRNGTVAPIVWCFNQNCNCSHCFSHQSVMESAQRCGLVCRFF
jgi:hypothetical protein